MVADLEDDRQKRDVERAAEFQRAYADAILAGDAPGAERVVSEAIEADLPETVIDDHVIRPALVLVGDLWAEGRITVADEHLATAISMRVLMLQREAFRVARARASRRVMLAAAQGEQHVVGLEMVASVLLHAGYDVRLFGADVPVATVAAAVARHDPVVVGFTAASPVTALHLPPAFAAARAVSPAVGILVGGQGLAPGLAAGWDAVECRHVSDAVEQVDALVKQAPRN